MGRNTYEAYLKHWDELETNVAVTPELAFLEPIRAELAAEEDGLRTALNQQAAGKTDFHEATRRIEGHVTRGRKLAVQLHDMIRGYYGRSAEKLNFFRMQPARPRSTSPTSVEAMKARKKKTAEQGPNPEPTAVPETDGTTQEM